MASSRGVDPHSFDSFCESPMGAYVAAITMDARDCFEDGGPPDDTVCPDTLEVGSCCVATGGVRGKCVEGLSEGQCSGEFDSGSCWNCYEPDDPAVDQLHGGGRCCSVATEAFIIDFERVWLEELHCTSYPSDTSPGRCQEYAESRCPPESPTDPFPPTNCGVVSWTPHYRCMRNEFVVDDEPPFDGNARAECGTEQGWCCTDPIIPALWTTSEICSRDHDGKWVGDGPEPQCDQVRPCCLPGGSGQINQMWKTSSECVRLGGYTVPEGESCGTGGCNLGCGRCVNNTFANECVDYGGRFLGEDVGCGGDPPGSGACCMPDGRCLDSVSVVQCTSMGGIFHGNKWQDPPVTCEDVDCPQPPPPGACCYSGGLCAVVNPVTCGILNGTFMGDGTVCDPNPC